MANINLELNGDAALELISQFEKVNGFLIAQIRDKTERQEEFYLFYQLLKELKKKTENIELHI